MWLTTGEIDDAATGDDQDQNACNLAVSEILPFETGTVDSELKAN